MSIIVHEEGMSESVPDSPRALMVERLEMEMNESDPEIPRVLMTERLQTEMSEREEENYLAEVKTEILKWLALCSNWVLVCVLFEIQPFCGFGLQVAFVPFVCLELGTFVARTVKFVSQKHGKEEFSLFLNAFGNLVFWTMIFAYFQFRSFNFILVLVPLVFFGIIAACLRPKSTNKCLNLVSNVKKMVMTILTLFFVGLKLENYVSWSWFGVLWAVWINLGFLYVASAFILGISVGSLCSFCYRDSSFSDVLVHLWLLYTITGASISATLTIVQLINQSSYPFLSAILYFLGAILFTLLTLDKVTSWWVLTFCEFEQYSIPSSNVSNQLSLPVVSHSSSRAFNKPIRLPPRELKRLTSTYFQPAAEIKRKKTMNSDEFWKEKEKLHKRNFSSPCLETNAACLSISEVSIGERKCRICFEGDCDAVLMDCGHGGICTACAEVLLRLKGKCHLCRAYISQVLKIKNNSSLIATVVGVK